MNWKTNKQNGAAARVSRLERMEAHTRKGDTKLHKYGYQN